MSSHSNPVATPVANPGDHATTRARTRRQGLGLIAAVVLLAGLAWALWQWLGGRHQQRTDNAYVAGHVVQITPQVAGTVVAIHADDTDWVHAGQPLVQLDGADAQLALAQAEAELARTVREVRALFAGNAALNAQLAVRRAELARAQAEFTRAQDDVNRRSPLVDSGAVGREEFQHATAQLASARAAVTAAQAVLATAQEQLATGQVQTDGLSPEQHPLVQRAAARVREAWLGTQRSTLLAPVAGQVARRSVQLGQRVQAGAPLMTVVSQGALWVDANFKENQLPALRVGQPALLQSDVYGSRVQFRGRVLGIGAGTGAAFALLPAQNATGNWIKIVQRVPVRIALDAQQVAAHPLRIGLSMTVTVDTREPAAGPVPGAAGAAAAAAPGPGAQFAPAASASPPQAHLQASAEADALVNRIIQASLGRPAARR